MHTYSGEHSRTNLLYTYLHSQLNGFNRFNVIHVEYNLVKPHLQQTVSC